MPLSDTALWSAELSTSFRCAGRLVHVGIVGLHSDGTPVVDVAWSSRPTRLTAGDMAAFTADKAAAVMTLQGRMWTLLERSA